MNLDNQATQPSNSLYAISPPVLRQQLIRHLVDVMAKDESIIIDSRRLVAESLSFLAAHGTKDRSFVNKKLFAKARKIHWKNSGKPVLRTAKQRRAFAARQPDAALTASMGDLSEAQLRRMPYTEYLKTEHWRDLRRRKLAQARNRCQICNTRKSLEVHHRTYERRGCEDMEDLTVLCGDCHSLFHGTGGDEQMGIKRVDGQKSTWGLRFSRVRS